MEQNQVKYPLVSVIMPVYNAGNYLEQALESLCKQTFTDFEIILINDGSTDNCIDTIRHFGDNRVWIIHNPQNVGLIASLNIGIEQARGEFIARMDQDDISMPDRFMKQVEYLKNNPETGVVGSWIKRFGAEDQVVEYPVEDDEIKASMFFFNPISHPGVMFRADLISQYHIRYHKDYLDAEDYHFWFQLITKTRFYNIPEVLLHYRIHPNQMGFVAPAASLASTKRIKKEALSLFGVSFSIAEEEEWLNIVYQKPSYNNLTVQVIDKVVNANRKNGLVDRDVFERKILSTWKNSFFRESEISFATFKLFLFSPLFRKSRFTGRQFVSVFKKYVLS